MPVSHSVRNPEGIWVNSKAFSEIGDHFTKYGYYTEHPWGSSPWYDFWLEERNRCLNGYSVGGAKITGDHYAHLNYNPINRTEAVGTSRVAKKSLGFPHFWDGDYNYFWLREIARNGVFSAKDLPKEEIERILNLDFKERQIILKELYDSLQLYFSVVPYYADNRTIPVENLIGGNDLLILKARRKGFSLKNSIIGVNNYFHRENSYTMYMAYNKRYLYPKGIFSMCMSSINFINDNTGWTAPSDYVRKSDHIRNSYRSYVNGVETERGMKSEIEAISFKDNPQAGVGRDAYDIIGEEVGTWGVPGGLEEAVDSMMPSTTDGVYKTGMMTLFGTVNDLDRSSVDIVNMFRAIRTRSFLPFKDVWGDEGTEEGMFFPQQLNLPGYYDEQGNSDLERALEFEMSERRKIEESGSDATVMFSRYREFPTNSKEALASVSSNYLPIAALEAQLKKVIDNDLQSKKGMPVELREEGGEVIADPIMDNSKVPITSFTSKPISEVGCPVIYEMPIENPPDGLYKIGYDPVRHSKGVSLCGILVYKAILKGSSTHSIIVAEYIGRQEDVDDNDAIAKRFAMLYNATIMHENETTGTVNYFRRNRILHLLAAQPDKVISKNVKNSRVARVWGSHMSTPLKEAALRYTKVWLETILDYDENGAPVTVIDRIYSRRLLEELIHYNFKGNFDLVSALFMCMLQVQEDAIDLEYQSEEDIQDRYDELAELMGDMIKN